MRGVSFVSYKIRMGNPPWKREPAKEMGFAGICPGEPDAHHERHAGFLWNHGDGPTTPHNSLERSKQAHDRGLTLRKEVFECILSAGKPHVGRDELHAAFRTLPKEVSGCRTTCR